MVAWTLLLLDSEEAAAINMTALEKLLSVFILNINVCIEGFLYIVEIGQFNITKETQVKS